MPNENSNDKFIKMQDLYKFKVFNPAYAECLTGTEWGVFMYILSEKLLYIRNDPTRYNGNTIKLDREFKDSLLTYFKISQSAYERLITKLCKGGILYRIKKDWYAVNPYCFAKGKDLTLTKEMMIFRKTTLNLKEGQSAFLIKDNKNVIVETASVPEQTSDDSLLSEPDIVPMPDEETNVADAPTPAKSPRTITRFLQKPTAAIIK